MTVDKGFFDFTESIRRDMIERTGKNVKHTDVTKNFEKLLKNKGRG